ncbi:MAG: glycosyltransferase family 2 protein [Chitinophagaceae bacterium]
MKISGFTIVRNALLYDYPAVEAITSILPVVDEMIVAIGKSDDQTAALIEGIGSEKIKIIHTDWDLSKLPGGEVLALETNKAFQEIASDSDWAFYIQCDEVVHEKYHQNILDACQKYLHDDKTMGLVFHYLHFYGTYDYIGDSRKWYNKEIRIIRNDKKISSFRDAQGFRMNGNRIPCRLIDAYIYHYGWVKNPKFMGSKIQNIGHNWMGTEIKQKTENNDGLFDYKEYDSLAKFTGTHPEVMKKRILDKNWELELDIKKKHFNLKRRLHYYFEKITGIRAFAFRNFILLKD